jgi:pimeloyl-ACP methyl ester carboxylesterase
MVSGFDGTLLAPFLQFPELGSEFDIWGLSIDMDDRSTFEELKGYVLNFLENRLFQRVTEERPLYIMGESFGALLTLGVVHSIQTEAQYQLYRNYLKGVVLINPATCYHRSPLARLGPAVANLSSFTYPFGLMTLLPLFTDEYAIPQLLLMLQGKALPFIINDKAREAYMGRVAFSLPRKLQFMPRETLAWRLDEWLSKGCNFILHKEQDISYSMATIPLVIIAGEKDKTLPSVDEAHRLAGTFHMKYI